MRPATLVLLLCLPAAAGAQTGPPPFRFDSSLSVGGFGAHHAEPGSGEQWTHDAAGEVTAGLYWTEHLKTEIAFTWTGESRAPGFEIATAGASSYPIYFSHRYEHQTTSIAQAYQFGRNAFFHPFVEAGVLIDRQRHTLDRPQQQAYLAPGRTVLVPALRESGIRVRARPFAGGGFKAYMSERSFFKTNLTFGFRGGLAHAGWTMGVGIDF